MRIHRNNCDALKSGWEGVKAVMVLGRKRRQEHSKNSRLK
jgi:hypothetical protein